METNCENCGAELLAPVNACPLCGEPTGNGILSVFADTADYLFSVDGTAWYAALGSAVIASDSHGSLSTLSFADAAAALAYVTDLESAAAVSAEDYCPRCDVDRALFGGTCPWAHIPA